MANEISELLNADSLFNSDEMRAAEELFMHDLEQEPTFKGENEKYFVGAMALDPNSAKYQTYRTRAKEYGTSYFLKIPASIEYDDTWDLLKEEYHINRKLIEEHCPHIVKYYDLSKCDDGRPFIRAEYIHGETLEYYLKYGARNDDKEEVIVDYFRDKANVRRFIRQFLECLKRMHELSVVHHDLKPGNLLIDCVGGNLYVIDFDLSVGPSSLNKSYGWTKGYEDPEAKELWNSMNASWFEIFGPQFDIYSFGKIIKEIFKSYELKMPSEYKRILDKCTCTRKNRYKHVEDIIHDFKDFWRHEGHKGLSLIKRTKTYQEAANGNHKAKQIIKEFMDFERSLR